MKKVKHIVLLLVFCLFISPNVYAFVPDAPNLINYMLRQKGRCSSYFSAVNSDIFSFGGSNISETKIDLFYSCSGDFRADWITSVKMLYIESLTGSLTLFGEEIVSEDPSKYFLFKDIFWLYDYESLMGLLGKRGCELSEVRLDKIDGKICYVVGKVNENSIKDQAELWIDKETFLPYYYNLVFEGKSCSFKFKQYFKTSGLFYPKTTEIFINNELTRKIDVKYLKSSFKPNSNSFFNLDKIKKLYKKSDSGFGDDFPWKSDSIDKIFE
ncbi:MAG: hypothetical protein RBR53_07540 [Desulforegulaceae bacterium]|nr:hypothetical protein [Desulforegulaceae bacterium]